jgi:plasmid stabilization system protein ParE
MTTPLTYRAEAMEDIDSAHAYYEAQLPGLGDEFVEALRRQMDRIADNPKLYGVLHRRVRAAPMRRFPYVIYYRATATDALIIAVLHGRRSTRVWRKRL